MGQNAGKDRRIDGMGVREHIIEENKGILLTAVIPVYNGERHLRKTLRHITQIDCQAMEVLLIDDGSSDQSSAICRKYEEHDGRIRYIRQSNQGVAKSRNRGIELARGEYICFWDQDDFVIQDTLFKLLHRIQSEHAQMGMFSTGRMIRGRTSDYERIRDGVYSGEEVRRQLLYPLLFRGYRYPFIETGSYLYGSVWKCVFRTDFVRDKQIRFRKFVNYEDDWIFVTHALSCADIVAAMSEVGYYWRVHERSESHRGTYIEDLPRRFDALDQYVLGYLTDSIQDKTVLAEYRKVSLCEHYVELFRNAANIRGAASMRNADNIRNEADKGEAFRRDTLRRMCYAHMQKYLRNTDYKRQLTVRKYLKSSAYRRRVILNSLRYGGIKVTCMASRLYDWFEIRAEKIQWIVRLERNRKIGENS